MKKHGNVKSDRKGEALRKKGMTKGRAARITTAGSKARKKGGRVASRKSR